MGNNNYVIPYDRLVEIATQLKDGLICDDEYEALVYMRDTIEMSPEEAEFFDVDFSGLEEEE